MLATGALVQATTGAWCFKLTTSLKCVNSGALAIETIWLAEGRSLGCCDQHNTIKSRQ